MEKNSWKETLGRFMYFYLLYSVTGWIYEVLLAFYYGWGYVNRGFLFGPYLPVYGFGAIALILCLGRFMKKKRKVGPLNITPLFVFVAIILITTAIEYATGYFMEAVFQTRWWDYSHYPYNYQGLICVSASFRFGLGGMVFLYVLLPAFEKLIAAIPQRARFPLACGVTALLLVDLFFTLSSMGVLG